MKILVWWILELSQLSQKFSYSQKLFGCTSKSSRSGTSTRCPRRPRPGRWGRWGRWGPWGHGWETSLQLRASGCHRQLLIWIIFSYIFELISWVPSVDLDRMLVVDVIFSSPKIWLSSGCKIIQVSKTKERKEDTYSAHGFSATYPALFATSHYIYLEVISRF